MSFTSSLLYWKEMQNVYLMEIKTMYFTSVWFEPLQTTSWSYLHKLIITSIDYDNGSTLVS
jgi:uncharacterized protein with von Willebrand factor type A (vWA) domain